ncbi:MAG: hypothetical protein ACOYIH_04205 [Candidatus Fimadaptatus sp.]|jgi:hypothetical protein
MKKMFALIASVLFIAIFASACSPDAAAGMPDVTAGAPDAAAGQPEAPSIQMYFGKVKDLVGNELTLRLAELPYDQDVDGADMQPDVQAADGGSGEVVMAATMSATTTVGEVQAEERMELKWLDEDKSFTLPAGLTITDMTTGQTVTMDALKKSSVVMLEVNNDTGSVVEVTIWEQP